MSGTLVWSGGFGAGVTLNGPVDLDDEWVQDLSGAEAGGDDWGDLPNRSPEYARFSYLVPPTEVPEGSLGDYVNTELVTVLDHNGDSKRVLHMELLDNAVPGPGGSARNQFGLYPPTAVGQAYIKYWIKLQPDLADVLPAGTTHSVIILEAKEHGVPRADFRWNISVQRLPSQADLLWKAVAEYGDLDDSPQAWELLNNTVPVPAGEWAEVEMFWKSDPVVGRFYFAVNGQVVFNYTGQTQVDDYIQVWWPFKLYVGSQDLFGGGNKFECWIEGMELWTDFPPIPPPTPPPTGGGMLLPLNSGHSGILNYRNLDPNLYGDCRYLYSASFPPIGLIDLRDIVPFSGNSQIGADALGNPTVNNNEGQGIQPDPALFQLGSILMQSPLIAVDGEWRELFTGTNPDGDVLPFGDAPYLSYINSKFDGYLIGACFTEDVLYLLRWTITPPVYSGTLTSVPGKATAVILDTIATAPADKPCHIWHELGGEIFFAGVLTGKLYKWDGAALSLDGTVGAGADVITEVDGDLIIAGTNFIKRRTGAGVYVDIMPTGGLTPPTLTSVGGLLYHASGTGDFGGIDTGTHVFTPTSAVVADAGVFIAGSVWQNSINNVSHAIVFLVSAGSCEVVAVRVAATTSTQNAGMGVMSIGEAAYQFDDASLDPATVAVIAGETTAYLQTRIIAVGSTFLGSLEIGDQLALTNGGVGIVLSIESDTVCNVATPIGNGKSQSLIRLRQTPVSAPGNKVFFIAESSSGPMVGMFDPSTDRWYWNRMRAPSYSDTSSSVAASKGDWRWGGLLPFNGDLVYTTKSMHQGAIYFPLWRIYMSKHFPVDVNTTGWQREYIFPPAGDQAPLYNAGYYQWWQPLGVNSLVGQTGPIRGGHDRYRALGANMGRVLIVLDDDGTPV